MSTTTLAPEVTPAPTAWPIAGEQRFAIHGVSWDQYEKILAALGDHPQRIAYC